MHWVLQQDLFKTEEWNNLINALERLEQSYSVHKVVPFTGEIIPEVVTDDEYIICFGSYSMRHSAKKYDWYPGVYDLEHFDFTKQIKWYKHNLLNSDSFVCEFEDVKFTEDRMFLRPIHDSKSFAGKVFKKDEFEEWQQKVIDVNPDYEYSLMPSTLVQVSKVKEIYAEYRFWIVDNQIVTCCQYKSGDTVHYNEHVDEYIKHYVDALIIRNTGHICYPSRAYVMDVCESENGLKIVETNTINSAGFYAADLQKLVAALIQ